jgi:transposase InsO family protein
MCEVLSVSRSGFHKWINNRDGVRAERHTRLLRLIENTFFESRQTYGVRRIHRQLKKDGEEVNKKVVEKLMRENGIRPKRRRKFRSTTDSKHSLPVSENSLGRQFEVAKPNQAWVSDITYIDTQEGWLYLATFIDLYSRKVVGWAMNERMTADLVISAYEMAVQRRGVRAPELVHSDRGSQYASEAFRNKLKKCKQSMSRKGNCWDNAVAESFFGTLKSELIYRKTFKTRKEAEMSIFEYIEIFYNKTRLHSSLGYVSPCEFEEKGRKAA